MAVLPFWPEKWGFLHKKTANSQMCCMSLLRCQKTPIVKTEPEFWIGLYCTHHNDKVGTSCCINRKRLRWNHWGHIKKHDTIKVFVIYETHIEVHEDRVVLSSSLLCSGDSLPGNGTVGKTHQNLPEYNKFFLEFVPECLFYSSVDQICVHFLLWMTFICYY